MKVLFFAPQLVYNAYTPPIPLGLLSIGSYLQLHGNHTVKIIDRNLNFVDVEKELKDFNPDVVGVSLLSSAVLKDAVYISKICHKHGKYVVWGGHFASACYNIVLKEEFVDTVSVGEGEVTWSLLLNALENNIPLSNITGIAYKDNGEIRLNEETAHMCAMEFPRCDFSLIDVPSYFTQYPGLADRMVWLYAAKGCYNQCTFCCNKSFNHQKYRKRNYDLVCDEIKEVVGTYGADGIYFGDELWCANKEEMVYNCDKLGALNLQFTWGCFLRVGILDREGYQYLYDHGCRWIFFGIESGYQERLKKVKKGISAAKVEDEMQMCYDIGIVATCSFMLGFPNETTEELTATASLMKKLSFYSNLDVYYFTPYVGSELYNELIDSGKIEPFHSISDADRPIWASLNADMLKRYSDVSFKDLKVIHSCAMLWTTFNLGKNNKSTASAATKTFFKKVFGFLKNITSLHLFRDSRLPFVYFRDMVKKYSIALWYALMYPGIKKRYNIKLFK